jgi:hypothetical protein
METILCPLCLKKDVLKTNYENRDIFKCDSCGNVWYSRSKIGGFSIIGDEILDEVKTVGQSSRNIEILINSIFRNEMGKTTIPYPSQIQKWASAYYLSYNINNRSKEVTFSKVKPIIEIATKQNEVKRFFISIRGLEYLITAIVFDIDDRYEVIGYNGEMIIPYPKYIANKRDFEIETVVSYYESGITSCPEYLIKLLRERSSIR